MRQFQAGGLTENIRLKALTGFMASESANYLSKIPSLSLDQLLEWKRLKNCGVGDHHKLNHFLTF